MPLQTHAAAASGAATQLSDPTQPFLLPLRKLLPPRQTRLLDTAREEADEMREQLSSQVGEKRRLESKVDQLNEDKARADRHAEQLREGKREAEKQAAQAQAALDMQRGGAGKAQAALDAERREREVAEETEKRLRKKLSQEELYRQDLERQLKDNEQRLRRTQQAEEDATSALEDAKARPAVIVPSAWPS